MIDYMGADHIMWGSDYPHEEGFAPHSKLAIRWGLSRSARGDVCRKILGGTPAGCTDSTWMPSRPLAARVGPTVAEVHTPLEDTGYRRPGGVWLPAVRRRVGAEASGAGPRLAVTARPSGGVKNTPSAWTVTPCALEMWPTAMVLNPSVRSILASARSGPSGVPRR